jgi:DNA-binding response OmpR family regulator
MLESGSVKVLIVEDDAKLARFLAKILAEEGYAADVCRSGADGLTQARTGTYDMILLDWMLPDLDGLSVCRELRNEGNTVPVLMLTARGELKERVLGLETGADDYVVKPFEVEELLARVHALSRRSTGTATMQIGALIIDRLRHVAQLDGRALDLTAREYALLVHLAFRPDRIATRAELLESVWDTTHDPGTNVVEVHISRLRDKLGEHAWMIETVRGSGYRLRGSRQP